MAGATSNGDQRVTNAKIMAKLETMDGRLGKIETRMDGVCSHVTRCSTRWDLHDTDHERIDREIDGLRADMKRWSTGGGILGAVAGVVAAVLGSK